MGFSAWLEACLGGRWHTLDPRGGGPRMGRGLIAHGRDAADVAISSTFDVNTPIALRSFKVVTDELEERESGVEDQGGSHDSSQVEGEDQGKDPGPAREGGRDEDRAQHADKAPQDHR